MGVPAGAWERRRASVPRASSALPETTTAWIPAIQSASFNGLLSECLCRYDITGASQTRSSPAFFEVLQSALDRGISV